MAALLIPMSTAVPAWWFVLACVCAIGLIPVVEWIGRSPQRRRMAMALTGALVVSSVAAFAAYPCPGCWDDCCPDFIPYGLCWPIGVWPC